MNKLCFPTGLNVKSNEVASVLCVKKGFDMKLEKRILDKLYSVQPQKKKSLKHKSKIRTTRKNEVS